MGLMTYRRTGLKSGPISDSLLVKDVFSLLNEPPFEMEASERRMSGRMDWFMGTESGLVDLGLNLRWMGEGITRAR